MTKTLSKSRLLICFIIPAFLLSTLYLISINKSPIIANPVFWKAFTIDLLISIPVIYYLLIRKTTITNLSVVPVTVICLFIGFKIIPVDHQGLLLAFRTWVIPVVEISVVGFIFFKIRATVKTYKESKINSSDFYIVLKETCKKVLPKRVVMPVVTEIAVFYYGFFHWKKIELKQNEFSYHKETGTQSLLGAFLILIPVEAFVFHILIAKWSVIAAWVLTLLSIYSAFQIFGFLRSMSKRPIIIEDGLIKLRYGIMSEAEIRISDIAEIKYSTEELSKEKEVKTLSILGEVEGHNIIIKLKNETVIERLYGFKKSFRTIAFHVDDAKRFMDVMNLQISQPST